MRDVNRFIAINKLAPFVAVSRREGLIEIVLIGYPVAIFEQKLTRFFSWGNWSRLGNRFYIYER